MAINNVGSYTNYAAIRTGAQVRPAATVLPTSYTPTPPAGGTVAPQAGGLSLGRMAAWAGGALAAGKFVLPMLGRSPGGVVIAGVLGAGAFAGNWIYKKLTGGSSASATPAPLGGGLASSPALRYASWGAGALAAWKLASPMLGRSPGGLVIGGIVGAGALAGNWLHAKLTGR